MKAVVCQHAELASPTCPSRRPPKGQVRLEVAALRHLRLGPARPPRHRRVGRDGRARRLRPLRRAPTSRSSSATSSAARSPSTGPECKGDVPTGTPVVALPLLRSGEGVDPTGLSVHAPGRLRRAAARPGVADAAGAQRPGARGRGADRADGRRLARGAPRRGRQAPGRDRHRLRAGRPGRDPDAQGQAACARSWPATTRPAAARWPRRCGADVVVDPAARLALRRRRRRGHLDDAPAALELAVGTIEKLERLPVGWWHVWRAGRAARRRAQAPGRLRVRRRPRRDRRASSPARRCSPASSSSASASGADRFTPGDGDQQGDRPALRARLHAAGVPRHAAHARRGQGRPAAADHRHRRARRRRRRLRRARRPRDATRRS